MTTTNARPAAKKTKATKTKVPVNERAALARVNRKYEADGEDVMVVRLRGRAAEEHGRFVLVPVPSAADVVGHGATGPLSRIEMAFNDLEKHARDLGVLRPWEEMR